MVIGKKLKLMNNIRSQIVHRNGMNFLLVMVLTIIIHLIPCFYKTSTLALTVTNQRTASIYLCI